MPMAGRSTMTNQRRHWVLLFELSYFWSDISYSSQNQVPQEDSHIFQFSITLVTVPSFNRDTVVRLGTEVFFYIINDNSLSQVSAKFREVLHIHAVSVFCMVSVEPMSDIALAIEVIQYPISIVLQTSCEDHYFVVLGHVVQEFQSTRSWSVSSYFLKKCLKYLKIITGSKCTKVSSKSSTKVYSKPLTRSLGR